MGEDDEEQDDDDDDDETEEEEEEYDEEEEADDVIDDGSCNGEVRRSRVSGKSEEQKAAEAADIGYKVVGPLDPSERPFKPWEPIFAVVQVCDFIDTLVEKLCKIASLCCFVFCRLVHTSLKLAMGTPFSLKD